MPDQTAEFTNSIIMPIRVTGKDKKRHDVDTIEIRYPILSECFDTLPAPGKYEDEKEEKDASPGEVINKLPVYENPILQWVQDALIEAVKREARNVTKVEGDDAKSWKVVFSRPVPSNWAKLLEEHKRQGGAAMANRWACIKSFDEWLNTLEKSQKAIDTAKAFFRLPQNLATVPPEMRNRFREGYLEPFCQTLEDEQLSEWETHISNVAIASQSEESAATDF